MAKPKLTAWDRVLLARHPKRPTASVLLKSLFPDFIELKGDRLFSDDKAIIGGLATLNGQAITVIAQEKGMTTQEKITHNFGMPHPEGYRKVLRLVKQAEKFNRPVLFVIDTPGAYPGLGAEERGQANAIAANLFEMIDIKVPLISVILSEGGSGGALAMGVSDQVWMFENAIYAVLSPEGFASILYKDAARAKEAADVMKITAGDLLKFKIIDHIIPENTPLHEDPYPAFDYLKKQLAWHMTDLQKKAVDVLLENRYAKYRQMGQYYE